MCVNICSSQRGDYRCEPVAESRYCACKYGQRDPENIPFLPPLFFLEPKTERVHMQSSGPPPGESDVFTEVLTGLLFNSFLELISHGTVLS